MKDLPFAAAQSLRSQVNIATRNWPHRRSANVRITHIEQAKPKLSVRVRTVSDQVWNLVIDGPTLEESKLLA